MASSILAPLQQILASNGTLGVGLKVFVYESGTTTKLTTYPTAADADAATNANTNPVVLDARGEPASAIWLPGSVSTYKLVLAPSTDTDPPTSPLKTLDGIQTLKGQMSSYTPLPSGTILQVQSTTKTDVFSTTATSFTDITGLSVSITPRSATSKILVMASVLMGSSNTGSPKLLRLMRDSTAIAIGDAAGSRTRSSSGFVTTSDPLDSTTVSVNHLDSPASASAMTYKLQMITAGGTGYVNRGGSDTDASFVGRFVSSITVMEVAG